jgi:hypothetical protein
MIRSLRPITFLAILSIVTIPLRAQVDADATAKTKALYANLKVVQQSDNFLFGQEFFNSFRFSSGSAHGDETFSDAKDITGSHPAVLGSDFHYYLEKDATERGYHTDAVKYAFQQGYVITFDWHLSARGTTSYSCSGSPLNLARNIATGNTNGDRDWFLGELDKVIDIINEDLVVNNDTIPIVFRPLHEMNGNWFWWGSCSALTSAEYKLLYQLVSDYVRARTKSVLFCWSPNSTFNSAYYPGDDYVDVIGVDLYEATTTSLRSELGAVVDFAAAHNKIAVFSETGDRNSDATSPQYWKNTVLPGITGDPTGKSKKIAWALTWINASWSEPYVAHAGSSAAVKQSFIDFKNSPNVLFGDEMPDMYTPIVPVAVEEDADQLIQIFPNPAQGQVTITTRNNSIGPIQIFDSKGKLALATDGGKELILNTHEHFTPGLFMIKLKGQHGPITRKLIIVE